MPPKKHQIENSEPENSEPKKQKMSEEEIDRYLDLNNYKLSNKVEYEAFDHAFPEEKERLNFMMNLKKYLDAKVFIYENIEGVMPKNRKYPLFVKSKY